MLAVSARHPQELQPPFLPRVFPSCARAAVAVASVASWVAEAGPGIRFNKHIEGDGPSVFAHACKLGLEGFVSRLKDSAYRFGRSPDWLKMKNPACSAVKREAEEDWGR
jgi:ATP-dependent DNA ligase